MEIADGVTQIGLGALMGCQSLQQLTLPFVGEHLNDFTSTLTYLFGEIVPSDLLNVTVTKQTSIAPNTFLDCAFIRKIEYKSAVGEIGKAAFKGCLALTTLSVTVQEETVVPEQQEINDSQDKKCQTDNQIPNAFIPQQPAQRKQEYDADGQRAIYQFGFRDREHIHRNKARNN